MNTLRSEHKLDAQIETFLSRKFKQFPELDGSVDSIGPKPSIRDGRL